eukprot:Lithocolla_globosa_v1_NODE_2796_length_1865_cov_9.796685.p2 type:complete len:104 gc:universal NODE_2796_length_1865_cov_9.796685:1413-1102(-)
MKWWLRLTLPLKYLGTFMDSSPIYSHSFNNGVNPFIWQMVTFLWRIMSLMEISWTEDFILSKLLFFCSPLKSFTRTAFFCCVAIMKTQLSTPSMDSRWSVRTD